MSPAHTGTTASATERCCAMADGSESLTVVPSAIDPLRAMAPVTASRASVSIVFPAPECPTSATLRTLSGCSGGATPLASARRRSDVPRAGPLDGVLAPFDGMRTSRRRIHSCPAGPCVKDWTPWDARTARSFSGRGFSGRGRSNQGPGGYPVPEPTVYGLAFARPPAVLVAVMVPPEDHGDHDEHSGGDLGPRAGGGIE